MVKGRMSYRMLAHVSSLSNVETYPASCRTRLVKEDQDEGGPDGGKEADEPNDESQHHALCDQVAESLGLEEARVSIALHGLEDIVFRWVEQLGVCTLLGPFDGILDLGQDALGDNDLSF